MAATLAAASFGLAAPSQAIQTAAQFLASLDEIKPICRKLEEPFWREKYYYGCGDAYKCSKASGMCAKMVKKRRPNDPPLTHVPASKDSDGKRGGPERTASKGSSPNGGDSPRPQ